MRLFVAASGALKTMPEAKIAQAVELLDLMLVVRPRLGFSPTQSTMVNLAAGIAVAGAGTALGLLLAAACTPQQFAMPSLMADLGMIKPILTALIAAVVIGIALIAVALGVAPTVWWLHKRSVATGLSQEAR